jgi:inhibitor of cysteine peptidase
VKTASCHLDGLREEIAMRKFYFVIAIITMIAACTAIKPLHLTAADNNRAVELTVGQDLYLELESNRTTGYQWWLTDSTEVVVVPIGKPTYTAPQSTGVGAGGTETWWFRAARLGSQTLTFEYRRSWEEGEKPAKTLRYDVTVK